MEMNDQKSEAPQIKIGRRIHTLPRLIKNGHLQITPDTHCIIQRHRMTRARRNVWSVTLVLVKDADGDEREMFLTYYRSEIAARCYVNRLMKKIDEARTVLQ
jgi:hypothetical protein